MSHGAPVPREQRPGHTLPWPSDSPPEALHEIWLVDLSACAGALAAIEAATPRLSKEERGWLTDDQDGIRRTTRIALRLLLERLLPDPDKALYRQMAFTREPAGRPSLPAPFPPRAFSLSHSGAHALIAIAHCGPLGIDFEAPRALKMPPHRRAALVAAAATFGSLPPGIARRQAPDPAGAACDDHATLIAWTRLEAVGKARGTGVAAVLADHGVITKGSQPTGFADPSAAARSTAAPIAVHDLALPEGLVGAIATPAGAPCPPVRALPTDPALLAGLSDTPHRPLDPS